MWRLSTKSLLEVICKRIKEKNNIDQAFLFFEVTTLEDLPLQTAKSI